MSKAKPTTGKRAAGGRVQTPAAAPAAAPASVYHLLGYQKRFIADRSRFRLGLWARQTGKSFTSALDAVAGAMERGESWLVLSAGERQSLEWMEKAKMHTRAWDYAAEIEGDTTAADIQRLTIRFPRGNRIIGLPANPDTARGYSMNVILDEFAFHERSREIWRALVPTITRGYRLVVLSTPNGQQNMFYELWTGHEEFAHHRVSIEDAVADGLDVNLAELQAAIDPDGWRQEFLCEFVDEAGALLPYDLLAACEAPEAGGAAADDTAAAGALYIGCDIGRKHDLTVIWILERVGDVMWTREVRVLEKTPFRDQLDVLERYLDEPRVARCCIDATGIGAMLAEEAQRLWGEYRVEALQFTAAVKAELAIPMMTAFQDRRVRIPQAREIREDLHKVRKVTTAAGNVRYLADRDDAGHADRFWALALALHAGATATGPAAGMLVATGRHAGPAGPAYAGRGPFAARPDEVEAVLAGGSRRNW